MQKFSSVSDSRLLRASGWGVQETSDGATLYIDAKNARGGFHGKKIEVMQLDDRFDPRIAADNTRKLIEEHHVSALFLTRGTPHNKAIVPHLEKHGVALMGPSTGAMMLHKPVHKHVFNVRATYQREAEKAVSHLASRGITRIAPIYVDDSFGTDALAGVQKGLSASKRDAVILEKIDRAKPDFPPVVNKVAQAKAQAVLALASGSSVVDAATAVRNAESK